MEGLRNDLLVRIERSEIETALLSVANRERLLALPGMPRHRNATAEEAHGIEAAKVPIEAHLAALGVVDGEGRARKRAIAISNRNLGTNHGHMAWQRGAAPPILRVLEDPADYPSRSCLVAWRDGTLGIRDLRFDVEAGRLHDGADGRDVGGDVEWATFGQQVLRGGTVARLETIIGDFYDARHVLAFDLHRETGERIRQEIYRGYPGRFAENVQRAWQEQGVPRSRYVHNAVGLSSDAVWILQREGTVEEIGAALRDAGASDGLTPGRGRHTLGGAAMKPSCRVLCWPAMAMLLPCTFIASLSERCCLGLNLPTATSPTAGRVCDASCA